MSHVLVLACQSSGIALSDALLRRAVQATIESGMASAAPRWLDPGIAAEITLAHAGPPPADLLDRVRATLAGAPIDAMLVPTADRRKRLFLADMDSTMIEQECIDELAAHVGLRAEVSAITERAMRGEIAFEPALRERVALLKGLPLAAVDEVLAKRITLSKGAAALLATMRANGAYCCLVSGGFTLFTGPVAGRLGFHEHRANRLVARGGVLTGEVEEPILGRDAKLATLVELRERLGLPREAVMAVGDGANDLAMLGEAGLGAAYRAKPIVAAAAHARLDYADLTALLYAQGYGREEFAGSPSR